MSTVPAEPEIILGPESAGILMTPEEFDAMVLREYESARDVAKAAKISVK